MPPAPSIPGVQDWLLSLNFSWAQELTIIMFVWMAKFGAAYGVRTGIHVGVDVLINRLDDRMRSKFIIFGLLPGRCLPASSARWVRTSSGRTARTTQFFTTLGMPVGDIPEGPTTPDLEWPTWIVYSAIPLGSSLMCFRFLQVMVGFVRTGELPHHDHGHVDGLEEEVPPVDVDVLSMDDNLHMHDLKHTMVGDNRRKQNVPTDPDRRKEDLGGEPK
jgi:C4-dicarboxylate transporter DctQ subunit